MNVFLTGNPGVYAVSWASLLVDETGLVGVEEKHVQELLKLGFTLVEEGKEMGLNTTPRTDVVLTDESNTNLTPSLPTETPEEYTKSYPRRK